MAPFFETIKSFADVPITDAGVDTVAFLEASEGLVRIFDILGSAAFTTVKSDLNGNIEKVRNRYNASPALSATLELLVENEKGEKKRTATQGLMWLLRGLQFTQQALANAQAKPTEELSVAFTSAYGDTLKKFHNMVVKGIFGVAMKACPYRAVFYEKLAADPDGGPAESQDKLNEEMNKWLAALKVIINKVQAFYAAGKYDQGF